MKPQEEPFAFFREESETSSEEEEDLPKMAGWSETSCFDGVGEVFGGDVSPRTRKRNRLELHDNGVVSDSDSDE